MADILALGLEEMGISEDIKDATFAYPPSKKEGFLNLLIADSAGKKWVRLYFYLTGQRLYSFNDQADLKKGAQSIDVYILADSSTQPVPDGKHVINGQKSPNVIELSEEGQAISSEGRKRSSTLSASSYAALQGSSPEEAKAWADALNEAGETFSFDLNKLPREAALALNKLKALPSAQGHSDLTLARSLRYHDMDVQKVDSILSDTAVWRKSYDIDHLPASACKLFTHGSLTILGKDKKGSVTIRFCPALHRPEELTHADITMAFGYIFERAIELGGGASANIVLIIDMNSMKRENADLRAVRTVTEMVETRYAGFVSALFPINRPWFFQLSFALFTRVAPPNMHSLVRIVENERLLEFWDASVLPSCAGGTNPDDAVAWLKSRIAAESALKWNPGATASAASFAGTPNDLKEQLMSGWMTKQGGLVKSIKKRWFVLTPTVLYYFVDTTSKPQGYVVLERTNAELSDKTTIKLVTPLRTYLFYVPNEEDAKEWLNALTKAVAPKKKKLRTLG